WSNVLRYRGIQRDEDVDGLVDDWRPETHPDESEVIPVFATYGGPDPEEFAAGEGFAQWPRPGLGDLVNVVGGGNETREDGGGDLRVVHGMNGFNQRLKDDTDGDGEGDFDSFEFDHFVHLVAMGEQVATTVVPADDLDPRIPDFRRLPRLIAFPSGEFLDNIDSLSKPQIARRHSGESFEAVLDEVTGASRDVRFELALQDEDLSPSATTIRAVSREGLPPGSEVPVAPGVLKIGGELVVYGDATLDGSALVFGDCIRGVLRTQARDTERGTRIESLPGIYVGILSESVQESSAKLTGTGFDRFPRIGCVRLEDGEAEQAELRIYTTNDGTSLQMPVLPNGGGLFVGRYGTTARGFESGTPVFWHPIRAWDRFAEFSDDAELSFWAFSAQIRDAYLKRIYWDEQIKERTNLRIVVRLNEAVPWDARVQRVIHLSPDGATEDYTRQQVRDIPATENKLKFLYTMEDKRGDNFLGLQADRVEIRAFVIFENGAFDWNDPTAIGWKTTPILEGLNLEEFRCRFGVELTSVYGAQVDELEALGLLERADGCLRLTGR
ncbi:MAG: hypothetical protein ACE5JG_12655, partial [Planctomycetota bacterium]